MDHQLAVSLIVWKIRYFTNYTVHYYKCRCIQDSNMHTAFLMCVGVLILVVF